MQYSSPLPSSLIFQSSVIPLHAHFLTSLQAFPSFAHRLVLFFPPRHSFSVDVWRALQPRGDGDRSSPGRRPQEGRLLLSVWRMEGGLCVWMLGEETHWWTLLHWGNKDQVGGTWELGFSITGGEAGEPGHALACVLFEAWPSQSPLHSRIANNQGWKRRINPPSCLQSSIYTVC